MINEIDNDVPDNMLRIEYMLGNFCNYKCHYCFPGSNEGDVSWPDIAVVKNNLYHLLTHYKKYGKNKFHFYLVGGEPTVWKDLPELCNFLKSNFDVIIELSTNASRSLRWWTENLNNFDHIAISVHNEFAKIDHIIEVADMLYHNGAYVNADVLMDPNNFDACKDIVNALFDSQHNWPIIAKAVYFDGLHKHTQDQLEYLKEPIKRMPSMEWHNSTTKKPVVTTTIKYSNGEIVNTIDDGWIKKNNLNFFYNWSCNIGVEIIKIFGNGRISSNCQQPLYGLNTEFNLYDSNFIETFDVPIVPTTCKQLICPCNRETVAKKVKHA